MIAVIHGLAQGPFILFLVGMAIGIGIILIFKENS